MTAREIVFYHIECDGEGCGRLSPDICDSGDEVRENVREQGWTHFDGRDFCPACWEEMRPKRKPETATGGMW